MIDSHDSKGSPKNQVPTKQKEKTLALFLLTLYNSVIYIQINVAWIHATHALSLLFNIQFSGQTFFTRRFDCTTSEPL